MINVPLCASIPRNEHKEPQFVSKEPQIVSKRNVSETCIYCLLHTPRYYNTVADESGRKPRRICIYVYAKLDVSLLQVKPRACQWVSEPLRTRGYCALSVIPGPAEDEPERIHDFSV